MERLTIKNKQFNDYSVAEELRRLDVRDYLYNINQKMGKYEDIEEELGIGLITLFKAKNNGFFVKLPKINNGEVSIVLPKEIDDIDLIRCLIFDNVYGLFVKFKDYGKTWALTKEELE